MSKRNSSEAQCEEPEQCKETKYDEPTTEDFEEAMYQVSKCAAAGREQLTQKAKEHFSKRNGREPSESEMEECFNTLRDSMMDEECGQSDSSDEEQEDEDCENLQKDIQSAYEHCRDLGKECRSKMDSYLKELWKKECGSEPSQDETEAVIYHMKHLAFGCVPVEDEAQTDDDEEYEPSELEKEAAEADTEFTAEKEECSFDFPSTCEVSEEQFEKACEKFCETHGREPTEAEADSMLEAFSKKLCDETFEEEDDDDYEEEASEESEDEECEEDKSMEKEDEMSCDEEESEDAEYTFEEQSNAFKYMKEMEEGSDEEEEEEEPSKQQQHEAAEEATSMCA